MAAAAALIVVVATVSPAVRGARQSTIRSLAAGTRPSAPGTSHARWATAARLPLPVAMGVRSVLRRPRQTVLAATSLSLAVAMVVAALAMERTLQVERTVAATPGPGPAMLDPRVLAAAQEVTDDRLRSLVYTLTGLMLALGAVNALIVSVFAARDGAANHARLRAVGFTPGQTVAALVAGQVVTALGAAIVGVPLGAAVFRIAYAAANGDAGAAQLPPAPWVAAAVAGTLVAAAGLAGLPARVMARRPVASALGFE